MPQLLNASDTLLDQSGATAVIQEFQRRGVAVQATLNSLAASAAGGNSAAAEAVASDIAYLRMVTDALDGRTPDSMLCRSTALLGRLPSCR